MQVVLDIEGIGQVVFYIKYTYSKTPLDRQAWYKSYIGEVAGLAVNRGLHIPGYFMGHNPLYTIHVIT